MIAAVSPATLRKGQRRAHLLGAAVLLAYVYAPLETELPRIRRTSRRFRRSPDGALIAPANDSKESTDATPRAR